MQPAHQLSIIHRWSYDGVETKRDRYLPSKDLYRWVPLNSTEGKRVQLKGTEGAAAFGGKWQGQTGVVLGFREVPQFGSSVEVTLDRDSESSSRFRTVVKVSDSDYDTDDFIFSGTIQPCFALGESKKHGPFRQRWHTGERVYFTQPKGFRSLEVQDTECHFLPRGTRPEDAYKTSLKSRREAGAQNNPLFFLAAKSTKSRFLYLHASFYNFFFFFGG